MKLFFLLFGVAVMASPVAPQGCATVAVGVSYEGRYGTYTAKRSLNSGQPAHWDILVSADGKEIKPLHR